MSDAANVSSANGGTADLGFDPDALRAKYREERDKRIRVDGNEQYTEVKGDFSRYVDDPYVDPGLTREPLNETLEIVIVGGGFGGLLAGARLRETTHVVNVDHRPARRMDFRRRLGSDHPDEFDAH